MTLLETALFWGEVGAVVGLIISLVYIAIENYRFRKIGGGGIKPSATPPKPSRKREEKERDHGII